MTMARVMGIGSWNTSQMPAIVITLLYKSTKPKSNKQEGGGVRTRPSRNKVASSTQAATVLIERRNNAVSKLRTRNECASIERSERKVAVVSPFAIRRRKIWLKPVYIQSVPRKGCSDKRE